MSQAIYMTGTDNNGNSRFYRAFITADLLGGWSLVREWGERGAAGQTKVDWMADLAEALRRLQQLARRKKRDGFLLIGAGDFAF